MRHQSSSSYGLTQIILTNHSSSNGIGKARQHLTRRPGAPARSCPRGSRKFRSASSIDYHEEKPLEHMGVAARAGPGRFFVFAAAKLGIIRLVSFYQTPLSCFSPCFLTSLPSMSLTAAQLLWSLCRSTRTFRWASPLDRRATHSGFPVRPSQHITHDRSSRILSIFLPCFSSPKLDASHLHRVSSTDPPRTPSPLPLQAVVRNPESHPFPTCENFPPPIKRTLFELLTGSLSNKGGLRKHLRRRSPSKEPWDAFRREFLCCYCAKEHTRVSVAPRIFL